MLNLLIPLLPDLTDLVNSSPVRIEFILFGLTLVGVAVFHHQTMRVALIGLASILAFKLAFDPGFNLVEHIIGSETEHGEWSILLNLAGLLLGFAILAKHFEDSGIPLKLPDYLPDDWKGPFVLLAMTFVLSSFLDNIAAAMIGGAVAHVVFKGKVHIGFLAALIAASNAGGSGSVVGDTTTTMMWIDGVAATDVLHAYVAAVPAFFIIGYFGARQQDKFQPILREGPSDVIIEWKKIIVVAMILAGAIAANVFLDFPAAGVWIAIILGAFITKTPWEELQHSLNGTIFLLSLVMCASMMPVEELPQASWQTTFGLGFLSSVFDNIPLTKLALEQGGYDWGMLAYAVGYGGSMIWFGSSAGVALSNLFPEARSAVSYVRHGWHVILAYIVGFFILLAVRGWEPHEPYREGPAPAHIEAPAVPAQP